ncbi:MAG TPA: Ig-like domain-containing protein [Longimicrobium sp.]
MKTTRIWITAALAALALAGAGGCRLPTTACTMELRVDISPAQKSIHVGDSFQAKAEGVSCGGRDRFPYEGVTWSTSDTGVIQLDAATGRITGLAAGSATVTAHDPANPQFPLGTVSVTVQP